jgi:ribosome-binding factor A
MKGHRSDRIAEMIHSELAVRLRRDVKDPRVTPISITGVNVSGDLKKAVIEWMPLGGGEGSADLAEGLKEAARRMRGPVGRALRLRHAPELIFQQDIHTEEAIRVGQLLEQLSQRREEHDE